MHLFQRIVFSAIVFSLILFSSCRNVSEKKNKPPEIKIPEGTRQMAAILKTIADTAGPASVYFLNSQRSDLIRRQMQEGNFAKRVSLQGNLGYEYCRQEKLLMQ